MSGAPQEQEQEAVESTPSTVTPAILAYLRDEGMSRLSNEILNKVQIAMMESLCTDMRMTDAYIRKETYILCRVIHHYIHNDGIHPIPDDYEKRVVSIIGSPMDDAENNDFIASCILSRGADKDEHVYNMAIWRMLALNSCNRMQDYSYKSISPRYSTDVAQRLCDILIRYSVECKFERTKDLYLHQITRSHLCCERISALNCRGYQSNPLKQISEYIMGDELTDLITPIIKTPVDEIMASTNWETETSNHVFILCVSLLQEMMDNHRLVLLTNTHIPFHENTQEAQLFIVSENCSVISAGYGIIEDRQFMVMDTVKYPIAYLLLEFITLRSILPNNDEYRHLLMCCESPEWVSASNPFIRLI